MRWLTLGVALLSFLTYGWAVGRVFSHSHRAGVRTRWLQLGGMVCALLHLWCLWRSMQQPALQVAIALSGYVAGLGIFFAARRAIAGCRLSLAFSPELPVELVACGIYSRIRHPFYLAYLLTWCAGVIAAPSVWTAATAVAMVVACWRAATIEERKYAASRLASQYAAYSRHAGMFLPVAGGGA